MAKLALGLALLAATAAAVAPPAAAQDLYYRYRTAGYWGIGVSGGNFKTTCDSACSGERLSGTGAAINLGFHVSPRMRLELGAQYQNNSAASSNASSYSVGAAYYLTGGLHVRGAATWMRASLEDSLGNVTGSGGPGFLVGVGYDLRFTRMMALTPYANFSHSTVSKLTRTAAGGSAVPTAGAITALNIGVALSWMRGTWECVTARGERIAVTPRHRSRALACLQEFAARGGSRPSGLKY